MTEEQRSERIHHHLYSGEGIVEHAERIVALEELVRHMYTCMGNVDADGNYE